MANILKREGEILKVITKNTKVLLAYLDRDFNFVEVNSAYAKSSGCKKKDLIGKNHFQLFPHKENERIFRQVKKTGKTAEFYRKPFEYPNQPEKGVTYWDWTLVPIKNQKHQVAGFVFSLIDVTEDVKNDQEKERLLKQVELEKEKARQLAIEEEKRASELDAVFTALTDPLFVYDLEGICVSTNPAALEMLGVSPIGLTRQKIAQQFLVQDMGGHLLNNYNLPSSFTLRGEVINDYKLMITSVHGKKMVVLVSAAPIKIDNQVVGGVVTMRDISEKEELEKQKDAFIAVASHELKTPVTTLKAYTQILNNKFNKLRDERSQHYLNKMDQQLNKLTTLISELLDVTKIETGKLELHKEKNDLDQLVKEVIEDIQQITTTHQIIKKGKIEKKISLDKDRINQVITNLLLNAIKYSPKASRVIVNIFEEKDEVFIEVQDFGIGISKDNKDKIFDRFFRVKGNHGERFPGLGLGLFICSEIIKRHHGTIGVKSREDKGSTFFFTLPTKLHEEAI